MADRPERSDGDAVDEAIAPGGKPSLKQRLTALFEDYGKIAIVTYFTLSILTIVGFSVAIWLGAEPSSATGAIGVIIAGWALAKATMPIRILITLALTPVVAIVVRRLRRDRSDDGASDGASERPDERSGVR